MLVINILFSNNRYLLSVYYTEEFGMKKEKVSFTVDRDLYLWFKQHSRDQRTPMSSIVNRFIMELNQSKEIKPKNLLRTNQN